MALQITIDGREFQAKEGQSVLEVARDHNIYIPTLCVNDAVSPYGACRLCLVEITTSKGREKLVTSCLYQAEDGLVVKTDSERISSNRRMIMELLLTRCPGAKEVVALAKKLGVEKTRFKVGDEDKDNLCILCALCVRACQEVVGVSAISLANRGTAREVALPFYNNSDACIACGSCAYICPTQAITLQDTKGTRTLTWPSGIAEFKLRQCPDCGGYWAPEKQLEYIAKQAGIKLKEFDKCPDCRD